MFNLTLCCFLFFKKRWRININIDSHPFISDFVFFHVYQFTTSMRWNRRDKRQQPCVNFWYLGGRHPLHHKRFSWNSFNKKPSQSWKRYPTSSNITVCEFYSTKKTFPWRIRRCGELLSDPAPVRWGRVIFWPCAVFVWLSPCLLYLRAEHTQPLFAHSKGHLTLNRSTTSTVPFPLWPHLT